jgi:hypothetical protein
MFYEVLPDPRALAAPKKGAVQVLQIHRPLPDSVSIGQFDPGGIEVVVEAVDQPRITGLQVGRGNAALEHIYLYSVPGLKTVKGLSELPAVKSFFAYDSRLELSWSELPQRSRISS